ncbi:MAG: hypothetical protein L6W00_11425 [Lentisphaeria bacterium]|nr:MAG: hypothetical protein L6W00_11425 [Lentisphaeria bacterium]
MSYTFGNQDFQLRLSERNGAIESITFHGTELAAPSTGMFTLRMYLHETGDYRFFQASEFPEFRREGELFLWSGHPEAPEFTVGCRITFDGEFSASARRCAACRRGCGRTSSKCRGSASRWRRRSSGRTVPAA